MVLGRGGDMLGFLHWGVCGWLGGAGKWVGEVAWVEARRVGGAGNGGENMDSW